MARNRPLKRRDHPLRIVEEHLKRKSQREPSTRRHPKDEPFHAVGGSHAHGLIRVQIDASEGDAEPLVGAVNGMNRAYTVSQGFYRTGTLKVYLNGVMLVRGAANDFIELNPVVGTFQIDVAPTVPDKITVEYMY